MGGVGIAFPQDTLAAATNPAGMALIGDRADVGLTWIKPEREATLSNTYNPYAGAHFSDGTFKGNARDDFFIPEIGLNKLITPDIALGVSIYGNGGMNTSYKGGIPLFNGGTKVTSGIDYIQFFVAPTLAWKVTPNQTIGASVNLGYQRIKTTRIGNFKAISTTPANLTDQGKMVHGIGLHLGWIGQITDQASLGASYQSKTYFEKFDKYKGLLADEGNMDAPTTFGVGIAARATPVLTIAAEVQRILFSDVNSIGNSLDQWNQQASFLGGTGNLGLSSGPGFGWKDVTVFKLGANHQVNEPLTLRAGYNHTGQPIKGSETLFNVLAPAVVQDHLTLAGTYKLLDKGEISFNYVHAFSNSVAGAHAIPAQYGGGNVDLKMHQDSVGVAYGWNF